MADFSKDGYSGSPREPGEPLAIECLPAVMEQIHAEVADAFHSKPRGGVEAGGVLYGVREKSRLLITGARPLALEHAAGPSFVLSANDRARMAELLEAPERDRHLAGKSVVGWYHSHTRSELDLTPQDLEIHDRYFPEPWQVALVLRPSAMRPTRVCFYYREAGGGMHSAKLFRETAAARPIEAPRAKAPAPAAVVEPPRFLAVQAPPRPRWRVGALVATLVCLLGAGAGYLSRDRWMWLASEIPAGLRLHVTDRQGQLEIRWDGAPGLLREASNGSLELVDGSTRRFILLDPKLLRSGSVIFARQSDTVRIHLTVEKPDGSKVEELTSFLGQAPPGSTAAVQAEAERRQAAEQVAAAEAARRVSERRAALRREAKRRDTESMRLAAQEKTPPAPKVEAPAVQPEAAPSKPAAPAPKVEPPAAAPR